nr:hypothetical protein [Tanacetum cinerariifolium]
MLTMGQGTLLQIIMLTDKGLQVKQGKLSVTTFKRKAILLETFQTDDLDAFASDCDDVPLAKAVLMANLSSYDSDVLSEESKINKDKYLDEVIDLQKKRKALDNVVYKIDLVHIDVNSLAAINDYKSMQQSFVDEYNETLVLKADLAKKNDMIEKAVYNELLKQCFRLENWCISLEIKLQQSKESFQNNIPSHNYDAPELKEFFIINELQAQLKAKNVSIEKLKEYVANIKGKNVVDSVQNVQNLNVLTSKVYKLDLPPLSPCIKNNMAAHVDYLKHTQENDDKLCEIIEHARDLRPLDSNLASACKFVTRIQESLVYVSATCPSSKHVSDKLVAVTPINRTRKVKVTESNDTSKDNTQKQVQPQEKQTTKNSLTPSTGVSNSTEASRSKPKKNTKKDRISQTSRSNKTTNKV